MILQAQNLTVAIGGKVICRDLNMAINVGECWAVLGQNGVGKTTLLRTLVGLHAPQAGVVSCNGTALQAYARRDLARHLAVLMQNDAGEFWGSVLEYVLLGRFPYRSTLFGYSVQDQAVALQAIVSMDLAHLAQRPLNALSGGERQRAEIAQVLAQQAQCYLLDEPLQHLDVRHQAQTMQLFAQLRQQRSTLLMAHIQVLQGFIQQITLCLLGQHLGYFGTLPFAAGQGIQRPLCQMRQIHADYSL